MRIYEFAMCLAFKSFLYSKLIREGTFVENDKRLIEIVYSLKAKLLEEKLKFCIL